MSEPVRTLIIDENATSRRCARQALEALGASVAEQAFLEDGPLRAELVLLNVSRYDDQDWDRLRRGLEQAAGQLSVVPLVMDPGAVPADLRERPEVAQGLERPFTPRQLCFAAFMAQPRLRPAEGEPPFPRMVSPDEAAVDISFEDPSFAEAGPQEMTQAMPSLPRPQEPPPAPGGFRDADWDVGAEGTNVELAPVLGSVFDAAPAVVWEDVADTTRALDAMSEEIEEIEDLEPLAVDSMDIVAQDRAQIRVQRIHTGELEIISSQDMEILEVEELEVVPGWATTLAELDLVLSRVPRVGDRARLLASLAPVAGLDAGSGWDAPEVAAQAAAELEALQDQRGWRADLEAMPLWEVLRHVRRRGLHAALTVSAADQLWVMVVEGDALVGVEAEPALPHTDVIEILLEFGSLDAAAWEQQRALREAEPAAQSAALVEQGLVSREDLRDATWIRASRLLATLCGVTQGTLWGQLLSGPAQHRGTAPPRVSHLLLEGARDQELHLPQVALQGESFLVRDNLALHQVGESALQESELAVLRVAQFGRSLAEVRAAMEAASLDSGDLEQVVARLAAVGLVDVL